jgi:hypothetical protein
MIGRHKKGLPKHLFAIVSRRSPSFVIYSIESDVMASELFVKSAMAEPLHRKRQRNR